VDFLSEAFFTGAFFTGAFFTGAFFTGAFFTGAFFTGAFFTTVRLLKVRFAATLFACAFFRTADLAIDFLTVLARLAIADRAGDCFVARTATVEAASAPLKGASAGSNIAPTSATPSDRVSHFIPAPPRATFFWSTSI
jgi:uncharacterized protein YjbI with pentapeptide repeats